MVRGRKHFGIITRQRPAGAQNIVDCLAQFLIDIIMVSETYKTDKATTVDTFLPRRR